MSKFLSQKIQFKNILIGVAIGLGLMFLTILIIYYIYAFLPEQKMEKKQKEYKEWEQQFQELLKEREIQPSPQE